MMLRAFAVALTAALPVIGQQFQAPFRLDAGGEPIVPGSGHGKPFVVDWDGDGVRDLLVGQFAQGRLAIYRNRAADGGWDLEARRWFRADGKIASVPFG